MGDFEDLYISIVFCLESISVNEGRICNKKVSTKASSFYKLIVSFDFIVTLVLTRRFILDLTFPVTKLLQGKETNMDDASYLLDSLKSIVLSKRSTVDELYNNCYRIILEIANKVSINEAKPCIATFQKNRNNVTLGSVSHYFEKVVTIPLLDHLLTQLNVRFDSTSVMVCGGLEIVPVKLFLLYHKNIDWRQKFRPFTEFYRSDFPCYKTFDLWEAYWLNNTSCHSDISSTLKKALISRASVILRYA